MTTEIEQVVAVLKPRWRWIDRSLLAAVLLLVAGCMTLMWRISASGAGMSPLLVIFLTIVLPVTPFAVRNIVIRLSSRRLCLLIDQLQHPQELPLLIKMLDQTAGSAGGAFLELTCSALTRMIESLESEVAYWGLPRETRARLRRLLDLPDRVSRSYRPAPQEFQAAFLYLEFLSCLQKESARAEVRPSLEQLADLRLRDPDCRRMSRMARGVLYEWAMDDAPETPGRSDTYPIPN